MSSNQTSTNDVLSTLKESRKLALREPQNYPDILRFMFSMITKDPQAQQQTSEVQQLIVDFMYETFINNSILQQNTQIDLAINSLDALTILTNVHDIATLRKIIDISCVIYRLVFQYVALNANSNQIWSKLTELKNSLVNKFQSNFPLSPSDNIEHDLLRNIATKLDLLKFMMTIIDISSKTRIIGEPLQNPNSLQFSLNNVPPNHSLIKYDQMEYESEAIFKSMVLRVFNYDIIIAPLITATLNHCILIMKRKPQFVPLLLKTIEKYDTNNKLQSNYQSLEQFKLARKYVDRNLRNFISHCQKNKLIPPEFNTSLVRMATALTDRGNNIRRKNIFAINEPNIRKRKFEGFYNPSKKMKQMSYSHLYTLNDINDELNNFDLSTLPQNYISNMVVNALQRAPVPKLVKALEIISERYTDAFQKPRPIATPISQNNNNNNNNSVTVATPTVKQGDPEVNDEDEEDERYEVDLNGDFYDPSKVFSLPPPKELSFQEKKQHISIIINNFLNLARKGGPEVNNNNNGEDELELSADDRSDISKALTRAAIKGWKKGNWLLLLSRLATRGMRTKQKSTNNTVKQEGETEGEDIKMSPDQKNNQQLSDMIRSAILEYFSENVHGRIDMVIEWLNEEWYSERVFQQNEYLNEGKNPDKEIITTPIYDIWSKKVVDATVSYIEPNDKKIFLRLLSDLPELNEDLIGRIKSLCIDPGRSAIGFLALQFLIMYRPPVKQMCIKVLQELSESDQEDISTEAKKRLDKFK
ncbi:cleavage factor II (CF II) component, putative [Candida dubliniensis CD36]|uniref:Pre-tRNA-processing protein, putative n=1 Tax=Candida dubliniensis (strain CD36 / ATCC MYA-646 / CBS 7987 / NCPF 3949 / NRRL Y-17841) TaxID=573826 RepID=B9WJI2_CANDC|nr:cleavage factor II (CF II) component, putative [Candida dubliniensis CD36]CAX40626.1 cleavage factor II (CF II) component, putative [Candida dubliniensis CD36]